MKNLLFENGPHHWLVDFRTFAQEGASHRATTVMHVRTSRDWHLKQTCWNMFFCLKTHSVCVRQSGFIHLAISKPKRTLSIPLLAPLMPKESTVAVNAIFSHDICSKSTHDPATFTTFHVLAIIHNQCLATLVAWTKVRANLLPQVRAFTAQLWNCSSL